MTAVVVDGRKGKEYRLPTEHEREMAEAAGDKVDEVFADIPFGVPDEPLPSEDALGMRIPKYGFKTWGDLFTPRQLLALGTFVKHTRSVRAQLIQCGYGGEWQLAVPAYLGLAVDRLADRGSTICTWTVSWDKIRNTFNRYALPITWDFAESVTSEDSSGAYSGAVEWVALYVSHALEGCAATPQPTAACQSAMKSCDDLFDVILTDPPYYDAIPYSDLMDFFYVWLRRTLHGMDDGLGPVFAQVATPKWDHERYSGELIEDESRFEGDKKAARQAYEDGMQRAFERCHEALRPDGRLGVVFANKQPDAWGTLAAALIRAGFVVDASWPVETEMANRTRSLASAALSSSLWLVCRKRPKTARRGWDSRVLEEMREKMTGRLRDFWDAGIRGPDFVWAATGPALEAYSKHPVVKKADAPGEVMSVGEFLTAVRRFVVDFQVGRVLSAEGEETLGALDDLTTYYLLHRNDFGMEDAPAGAVILYSLSCGISDSDLAGKYDLVEKSGSSYRLKRWQKRTGKKLGYKAPGNGTVPMVDMVHRLLHLWRAGEVQEVDGYIEERGLRRNELFSRVLQAIIELSSGQERSLLESISNHLKWAWTTTAGPESAEDA